MHPPDATSDGWDWPWWSVLTDSCRAIRLQRAGPLTCFVLAGLLTGCTPRSQVPSEVVVEPSELVPFEDLFAFKDTLVLDPSVILGRIWFMDVDASGSLLITDISSNLAHLFAPTGQHQVSYNMDTCLPSDFGHDVWTSRFADNDRVILSTMGGAVVVFDRAGNCLAAKQLPAPLLSFCAFGDSIFTYRGPRGGAVPVMNVYSMELELEREIRLEDPELYRLNQNYQGFAGWDIDCFDNGPWYKYHEDMDAKAAYEYSRMTQAQPDFFVRRDQDLSIESDIHEHVRQLHAFPLLMGVYALGGDTRMGVFSRIGEEFRPENATEGRLYGLSIVSNSRKFRSTSTVPYKAPETARHGHLYFLGDNVPMDDGDVGNQAVIRYKFKIPEAADD